MRRVISYFVPSLGIIFAISATVLCMRDSSSNAAGMAASATASPVPETTAPVLSYAPQDAKEAAAYRESSKMDRNFPAQVKKDWDDLQRYRKITFYVTPYEKTLREKLKAQVGDLKPYTRDLEIINKIVRLCSDIAVKTTRAADHAYSTTKVAFGTCDLTPGGFTKDGFKPKPTFSGPEPRPLFLTAHLVRLTTWGPTNEKWDTDTEKFYQHFRRRERALFAFSINIAESRTSYGKPVPTLLDAVIVPDP